MVPLRALLIAGALAAAIFLAPARATASPCPEAVIADWRDDGRIDRTYAPRCYRAAIAMLPEDVLVYSTAESDINRALQARVEKAAKRQATGDSSSPSLFKLPLLVLATLALLLMAGFAADAVGRR